MHMLILHIIIALISLAVGVLTAVRPTEKRMKLHFIGAGSTLVTGIGLVVAGYSFTHVCAMGGLYLAFAFALGAYSYRRLALENTRS